MSRTAADIIEIGRDLIAQKGALGHGNYLAWIEAEFGMSDQTARRFTHVAGTVGGKSNIVLDLPPSVLYALAAPSTEEPVREEVIRRAEAGEKVTTADVDLSDISLLEVQIRVIELGNANEGVPSMNDQLTTF
jgi:mannose/cellobiose epimerase-like protein (N-acyl-D-glucosamine 2-epimerase family)